MPWSVSHAFNGAMIPPVHLRTQRIFSISFSSRAVTAPPRAAECPSMCLVVL